MVSLGLVVSSFNRPITAAMEEQAREAAADRGAAVVETVHVPGAYDTPLAADRLARRADIEAVAVIGAVITGETGHDEVIAEAAVSRLTDVSLERDTPVTLGINCPDMTADQAQDRTDYGARVVESAIDLVEELG